MSSAQTNPSERRRRRLQFSLRTMLLAMLVVALLLGWLGEKAKVARRQQRAAEAILAIGGHVQYAYQRVLWTASTTPRPAVAREPPGPRWLRWMLGEHFFAQAVLVWLPSEVTDDDLAHLDDLPYLTDLGLPCAEVSEAGLRHVWKHHGLRLLSLRGVPITDADLVHLRSLNELQSLDLSHTPITDEAVQTLRRLPNLRGVELEGTHVSREAARDLPFLGAYPEDEVWAPAPSEAQRQVAVALEREGAHVSVWGPANGTASKYHVLLTSATTVDDRTLDLLEQLEALRGLTLVQLMISDEHWARIAGDLPSRDGRGLTRLETLGVAHMPLTEDDMRHVGKLVNLQALNLRDTRVTDAGLAHLGTLRNLEVLCLNTPRITGAGLAHLAGLPRLRMLSLYGSQFTDAGLKHVGTLSQLEEFELWGSPNVTDAGLSHLARLKNLTRLTLDCPKVTETGLVRLAELTSLTELSISCAPVSEAALDRLRKLPRLEYGEVNGTVLVSPLDDPTAPEPE